MGLDFVELTMSVEEEFGIKISEQSYHQFFVVENRQIVVKKKRLIFTRQLTDIRVQDFVDFVAQMIKEQNPGHEVDVFNRIRPHIAAAAGCDESMVMADSLMTSDLGMM
jgi:hypothetical protein